MIYTAGKGEVPSFPLGYTTPLPSSRKYWALALKRFMAPTVSCRGGLMELRQPSRQVIQLSQQLFASQNPKPNQPQTPETVTRESTCKAGSSVASSSYGPLHALPAPGCPYVQWSYTQPSTLRSLGQALGHGLCWGSWPAMPSPSLTLLQLPRSVPLATFQANSTPCKQLSILQ